jgi:hypothetical protein
MKSDLERIWMRTVMAQFKAQAQHLLAVTEENHENPQDSRISCPKFEQGTSEYESGILTIEPQYSLSISCNKAEGNKYCVCSIQVYEKTG